MINEKLSKEALQEAYEILKLLDNESLEKVPEEMLNAIDINRDKTYIVDITKLFEGEILEETKEILSAIYSEYLATEEEKKVIDEYANSIEEENKQKEDELKVGMPIDLFNNESRQNYEEITNTLPQVVANENIFIRILNKIKSIFKKNK